MGRRNLHNRTLENILKQPSLIDESSPLYVIAELRQHKRSFEDETKGIKDLTPMCDILVIHKGYGVPVEVKGTPVHRNKALRQLEYGREWILNELGLFVPYKKIVYYGINGLNNLVIEDIR